MRRACVVGVALAVGTLCDEDGFDGTRERGQPRRTLDDNLVVARVGADPAVRHPVLRVSGQHCTEVLWPVGRHVPIAVAEATTAVVAHEGVCGVAAFVAAAVSHLVAVVDVAAIRAHTRGMHTHVRVRYVRTRRGQGGSDLRGRKRGGGVGGQVQLAERAESTEL